MTARPERRVDPLPRAAYEDLVRRALAEDVGSGDVTTTATVPRDAHGRGTFIAKAACVVAGLDVAREVFRQVDSAVTFEASRRDGDLCRPGDVLAAASGPASSLLTAERTALNFLQRSTGIATLTRRFVDAAGPLVVLDTRKTTPTFRALERHAVRCGGGTNHRAGLYDAVLIKDNHVRLAGGVANAVALGRRAQPSMQIEVEAQSLSEVDAAVDAGADIILLDNLSDDEMREAVARVAGRARLEISGGVTLERMAVLRRIGADSVSIGALTHSAPASDISFEIATQPR